MGSKVKEKASSTASSSWLMCTEGEKKVLGLKIGYIDVQTSTCQMCYIFELSMKTYKPKWKTTQNRKGVDVHLCAVGFF